MSIFKFSIADNCPLRKKRFVVSTTEEQNTVPCAELLSPCPVTSNSSPRKERRDAAEHRQHILAIARTLFAAQGVDSTSMHEIARTAGVGQGTLYRRYAHKGELCAALLEENAQRFREEIESQVERAENDDVSALGQLDVLLTRLAEFTDLNGPLLGAIGDAACGERRHAAYTSPLYQWLRTMVLRLLQRAVKQGEAHSLDVEGTVDAVLAPLSVDLYLYQRRELGHSPERIIAALRRLLFVGLNGG